MLQLGFVVLLAYCTFDLSPALIANAINGQDYLMILETLFLDLVVIQVIADVVFNADF